MPDLISANTHMIMIGTAGWSIPAAVAVSFPGAGSHLQRYARALPAVEINSSFHRPHKLGTYQRWAATVPPGFRFAVKLPKAISHVRRLVDADDLLNQFVTETAGLGDKLAVILVQLPPSLAFDAQVAGAFFDALRRRTDVSIACEPRHASWFSDTANACLASHHVARVAADPVLAPGGERPGGWPGLRYHRLHGAPRIYYSSYGQGYLDALAGTLTSSDPAVPCWYIFDNTASGAATADAMMLRSILAG